MKRVALILAVVVLAAGVLFALLVMLLPRDTLKTRIGEQIAAWTGRDVALRGDPDIDFFPELTVTLNDVEVGGPAGMREADIVSMDRLTGTIRLLPLLIGRVEIGSFTLVRPRIRLVRDAGGVRNWTFDSGAAALQLAFAGDVPLGEFVLQDGTLIYENRAEGVTDRLDSLNLTVEWHSVRQPVGLSGSGIWRGELVSFSAGAESPFDYLNGGASPVEARFDSAPIAVQFSGAAGEGNETGLSGALTMSTPSLRGFMAWLGSPVGPGSTLGAASLSGTATFRDNALSVENAQLTLDANTASGALEVVAAAKPEITGTLAFPSLDLTAYLAGFADAFEAGGDWRAIALGTDWFDDLSADIRLSAGSVRAGDLLFGDTAASVALREARLEVGVARAAFYGGNLTGVLAVTDAAATPEAAVESQLRAADFDLAEAMQALGGSFGLSGTASVTTDLSSQGRDFGSLMNGLGGTARLDLRNGAFPLLGIAEIAVGGAGANPAQTGVAATTPVKTLSLGFSFARGVAILELASVAALSFTADAKGWIGLEDGSLGLNGTVKAITPGVAAGPAVPFTIDGTLAKPAARPLTAAN